MEEIRLSDAASVEFLDGGFMEITVSPGIAPGLVELPARETELLRNALNKRAEQRGLVPTAPGRRYVELHIRDENEKSLARLWASYEVVPGQREVTLKFEEPALVALQLLRQVKLVPEDFTSKW